MPHPLFSTLSPTVLPFADLRRWALALLLTLPSLASLSLMALADIPPEQGNGFLPNLDNASSRFFQRGRARFELEIENLSHLPTPQPTLTVDDKTRLQDDNLHQLEQLPDLTPQSPPPPPPRQSDPRVP